MGESTQRRLAGGIFTGRDIMGEMMQLCRGNLQKIIEGRQHRVICCKGRQHRVTDDITEGVFNRGLAIVGDIAGEILWGVQRWER